MRQCLLSVFITVLLFTFNVPGNIMAAPFDCSSAIDLGCGGSYSGTTAGVSQVLHYNCVFWDESGPEFIFRITPTERGALFAQLSGLTADLDLFLLTGCDDTLCIEYGDDTVYVPDLSPGTYFLVVDGYDGDAGNFTIDAVASCFPTPTPVGTWYSRTPTSTPPLTRTPVITPTPTGTPGLATFTPTPTWTRTSTPTYTPLDTSTPVPTPPDSCDAEKSLFEKWDVCERLQSAMTPPPSGGANNWMFDDCDYCRDAGNSCFKVPCTFAMYVVAECGTEFHVPLWDNETGHIRIKDCIRNRYVSLRASSTGGWSASGTDIQWEDCTGTVSYWNNQVTDIFFSGSPTVCGVYRVEFIDWGGFIWELFANCDGTDTPVFMIYENYDIASKSFHLYPELSISNLKVVGTCPEFDVTFDVANSGCSTLDAPICLSTTLGGMSWRVNVRDVGPGDVVQGCARVTVPDCPFGDFVWTAEVDCDDDILECNEVPGGALGCSFGPSFSDKDETTIHVVPSPTPTLTPKQPTPTPIPDVNCCWHLFKNAGPELNTGYQESYPWLASDTFSVLYDSERSGGFGGHDIYVATTDGSNWVDIQNLGANINTASEEAASSLNHNGDLLFFHSNRPAGLGGYDMYSSQYTIGGFAPAANLGVVVNSAFDDFEPCISPDAKTLYFCSNRIGSMGGSFDIYKSTRTSVFAPWGTPVNLGLPINSAADEMAPVISPDATTLYFESDLEGERLLYVSYWRGTEWSIPQRMCPSMQKARRPSFNMTMTQCYFYTDEGTVHGREDIWEAACPKTPIPTGTWIPTATETSPPTFTPRFTPTITPTFTPPCGNKAPEYFDGSFTPPDCVADMYPDIGIDVQSIAIGLDTTLPMYQYSIDGGINWLPHNSEAEDLGGDAIFVSAVTDPEAINGLARFAPFNSGLGKLCTGPGATGFMSGTNYVTIFRIKISKTNCQSDLLQLHIRTASSLLAEKLLRASNFVCHDSYNEIAVEWTYDGSGPVDTIVTFYPDITDVWVDAIKTFLIGSVTGTVGSTAIEHQTGVNVPFNQISSTLNKARFAIFDTSGVLGLSSAYNVCIVTPSGTPWTPTPTPRPTATGPGVPVSGYTVPVILFGMLSLMLLFVAAQYYMTYRER